MGSPPPAPASSNWTTWRLPRLAFAVLSSTLVSRPPNTDRPASSPLRLPSRADGARAAGRLYAPEQRIAVTLFIRRGMFKRDLAEFDFELFRDQHRDRGVGALPHLDIGHRQRDLPARRDPDIGVGNEIS